MLLRIPAKPVLIIILSLITAACASTKEKTSEEAGPYAANQEALYNEPTVVSHADYKDPLKVINRPIFMFNDVLYRYFLSPVSKGYQAVMPDSVANSVSNFFSNVREPLFSLNNLFQAKPRQSGTSLMRFVINSTVGLLGFFDPADSWWNIEKHDTDFGDTLALHGVGYGTYIVLPLLGPSDLRDGGSKLFTWAAHPLNAIEHDKTQKALKFYESAHDIAPTLSEYPELVADREDRYTFIRNLYLQNIMRDADVIQEDKRESEKMTMADDQ